MTEAAPVRPRSPAFVRTVLALLAGLGVTVFIVVFGTFVSALALLRGADARHLQAMPAYLAAHLVMSTLGAAAGGWTTARVSDSRSSFALALLALILFVSAAAQAVRGSAPLGQPPWYPFAVALLGPIGIAAGALWERRGTAAVDA